MKRETRALLTIATLFGLFAAGADAHADSKHACADAHEKTQSLRESGQLLDARKQAVACSASTCSVYVTRDCRQWLSEIYAILPTVVCGGDPARYPSSTEAETRPLADQRTRDRNVFLGLAAAGVVGIGVAVVGIATAPSKSSTPRTSFLLAPYGSPLGGGLTMQGQF